MIVLVADRASFAADRRKTQEDAIRFMEPIVTLAVVNFDDDSGWYDPILDEARDLFNKIVTQDGGSPQQARNAWRRLRNDLRTSLTKTSSIKDYSSLLIATYVTSAVINVATVEAAHQGDEPFGLEWISMHDDKVRATHVEADGQRVRAGQMFHVGLATLRWPGDTRAPIKEWINCRCTLAPVPVPQSAASAVHTDLRPMPGGTMTTQAPESTEPDTITAPAVLPWHGVLAPEDVWSGDKRKFAPGSLSSRNLPLPLTWQKSSDEGHKQSVTVASIDYVYKTDDGLFHGGGSFMQTPEADEAVGLLAHFGRYGVSVDADDAEFDFDEDEEGLIFSRARVAGASMVGIPAFQEAYIMLGEDPEYTPASESLVASLAKIELSITPVEPPEDAMCLHPGCEATPTMSVSTDDPDWFGLFCATHAAEHEDQPLASKTVGFGRGPGWITNPADTKRIHDYWTVPGEEGYIKIGWGTPGDFNRCRVEVGEEIAENSPDKVRFLNQICAQWHKDATGFWPGHAPTEQASLETPTGEMAPGLTLVASVGTPLPSKFFTDPEFQAPTPITVTDELQISGHLAVWGTCHTGFDKVCVQPPPSANDYAYFLTGEVETDQGPTAVGNICMVGGHAPHRMGIPKALAFYDSTSTVVADITVGEDDHGIWINGMMRELDDEKMREFRASSLSGDWRTVRLPHGKSYELIAALCVNSPGFPVARVGTYSGEQTSLVASAYRDSTADINPDLADFAELVAAALDERQARRRLLDELGASIEMGSLKLEEN